MPAHPRHPDFPNDDHDDEWGSSLTEPVGLGELPPPLPPKVSRRIFLIATLLILLGATLAVWKFRHIFLEAGA